ncbi:MAG: rRNA (uracil1498-N3)-methyltransferase [Myxococcales bacterium]|nr:rRNA (uracil1498-N3)-methyltransferase [Myxococcales bacterium]
MFVAPEKLGGDRVVIDGDGHHHLGRVLRLRRGDKVVVFDGQGTEIDAEVADVGPKTTALVLGERRRGNASAAPTRITLLQGLARGEKMDWIIQKTCELGVARVVPVLTGRTVAAPAQAAARRQRWERIAREAARQSGRADVPTIEAPTPLTAALDTIDAGDLRLAFWEAAGAGAAGRPLRAALPAAPRPTTLLVGPEGGFSAEEMGQAETAGFVTVGLGPRILRTETAAVVAVALLQFAAGGLD